MSTDITVAVIGDVHGNDLALRAVLGDLASVHYDALVVAGDHVFNGPRPAEALARLRSLGAPMLLGNTDAYLWTPDPRPGVEELGAWTAGLIGEEGVAALRAMPVAHRITPPGGASPDDDLLVVHATPTDIDAELILEADPIGNLGVTPVEEARALLGDARASLIVYGHLHYASAGTVDDQRVVSIGSVGASLDGDPRAAWALARWDGSRWAVEHRRTPYDHHAAAEEIARIHPIPHVGAVLAERLRQGRWLPFGT